MTRSESKQQLVRDVGGVPVVADALDPESVAQVVARAEPEVIVHQLTAIPHKPNMRRVEREFALTNRLRTEGTDHLLAAGRAVGVRRFVAQSNATVIYARVGGAVKVEEDALDATPPDQARTAAEAVHHLESAVTGAGWTEGVVLRYGAFYGPGTNFSLGPEDAMVKAIRKRQVPLVGKAGGVWSFIHIADAAAATVNAIEGRGRGVYNVVDDEPAAVAEWLPAAAARVGASAPRRVPRWLGRLLAGEFATVLMTEARGDLERQGQAGARLGAPARELARGLRHRASLAVAAQELYQELRPGAFAIAYRMLGSVSEAEDLVQEGLLRLHRALEGGEPLGSPKAYLSTVVTRLAIDELRSARLRRETYVGEWLPEPMITSNEDNPALHAEMADSLSLAFLVVLESLSPEQRAVFLLREVFDYPYDRIAAIVGKSEPATRQIAARARRHVDDTGGRGTRRPSGVARSWRSGSSRPSATATLRRSSRCSPRTSSCTATAAAAHRRSLAPCTAGAGWRAPSPAGSSGAGAPEASRSGAPRSTASLAR